MITATLPSYFSSGPNKLKNGVPLLNDRCDENWWYNFLYVNNLFITEPNEKAAAVILEIFLVLNYSNFNFFNFIVKCLGNENYINNKQIILI